MNSGTKVLDRKALFALISVLLTLNLLTFLPAYSQVSSVDSGCCSNQPLAKDFSAFYTGAWRLYHDPAQIYVRGYIMDGEPFIYPQPEQYKYLPSFLVIVSPLLLVPYPVAIDLFDNFQFLLLPLIGLLVYRLTKEKGWAITIIAETFALLLPAAAPGWGFSVGYFWQWKEGQSKVLETLLLTASFYLGTKGKPVGSGVLFGLAFFDPRFAIVATPLFLTYNAAEIGLAVKTLLVTVMTSNFILFYPGIGISFLEMVFTTGISTALYPYAAIPLVETIFLTFINFDQVLDEMTWIRRRIRIQVIRRDTTTR